MLSDHAPDSVIKRSIEVCSLTPDGEPLACDCLKAWLATGARLTNRYILFAPAWPLEQMSSIDRNILLPGNHLSNCTVKRVPVKVAINEAVELSQEFQWAYSSPSMNL
jgi:hypothetical protein